MFAAWHSEAMQAYSRACQSSSSGSRCSTMIVCCISVPGRLGVVMFAVAAIVCVRGGEMLLHLLQSLWKIRRSTTQISHQVLTLLARPCPSHTRPGTLSSYTITVVLPTYYRNGRLSAIWLDHAHFTKDVTEAYRCRDWDEGEAQSAPQIYISMFQIPSSQPTRSH